MFKLTKNKFLDNKCWYEDEFGNKLYINRQPNGFIAKIRFANSSVSAQPLSILLDRENKQDGEYLHLDFSDSSVNENTEEIKQGIIGMTDIIQRWISLTQDVKMIGDKNNVVNIAMNLKANGNENPTEKDITTVMNTIISSYEELSGSIGTFLGVL